MNDSCREVAREALRRAKLESDYLALAKCAQEAAWDERQVMGVLMIHDLRAGPDAVPSIDIFDIGEVENGTDGFGLRRNASSHDARRERGTGMAQAGTWATAAARLLRIAVPVCRGI